GAQTYQNVTVTTKTTNYIFILHSGGMANIKAAELSPEVRTQLGFVEPPKPAAPTNTAKAWANQTLAKLDTPEVKRMKGQFESALNSEQVAKARKLAASISPTVYFSALGGVLLCYIFFCYCCRLLCQKAG